MEKEFIPYEEALILKELGFDEHCFAFYNGKFLDFKIQGGDICASYLSTEDKGECPNAPLYQQAFRWFREKHNLSSQVECYYLKEWFYFFKIEGTDRNYTGSDEYNSYEEEQLACLKKLIEIVRNK